FIVPLGLFSGGFTGISQLLLRLLTFLFPRLLPSNVDLTGILLWGLNLPLFFLAWRMVSKTFLLRTVLTVLVQSACMVAIPAPTSPLMSDTLTCIIVGGSLAGLGVGLTLRFGGCGGGADIVGIYCAGRFPRVSVGKLCFFMNACIYLIGGLLDSPEIAVYSVIFSFVESLVMDRIHEQNIMTLSLIVTKSSAVQEEIIHHLNRGCTIWEGQGGYQKAPIHVIMTTVSGYERRRLDASIRQIDPHAFITYQDGVSVLGNFEKRFDA
ncbi:MAG: YitT family protein, partial [Blautia sp.]|nr:YitT family protein [Blautia sp.]